MTNLKKPLLITSGLLALGISAVAVAGPGHHGMKRMMGAPGMRLLHLAEKLELTEAQEVQAVRMRRAIRQQAKANREQTRAAFQEVLVELEKPEPDAAKLHRLVDEGTARMNKLMRSSVDEYLTFHRTLTEEQRTQLVEHARHIKERRKGHRGKLRQLKK